MNTMSYLEATSEQLGGLALVEPAGRGAFLLPREDHALRDAAAERIAALRPRGAWRRLARLAGEEHALSHRRRGTGR